MLQLRGPLLQEASESVMKIVSYSLHTKPVVYLNKMPPTSWLAAKTLMNNIFARCLCSKPDQTTTQIYSSSVQGIDMTPAIPKKKEEADPLEIPEPAMPEEPLPGMPVPSLPDVAIPFVPENPLPELPEFPVPVKPGSFPIRHLPGAPKPIFEEIPPKWRAPVMPDLTTLFTSPIVLNKAIENYKAEYLMLTSCMEVTSTKNNYFYKKCGLPKDSIIQPIDKKLILKLQENDAPLEEKDVNNLILAISALSPVQVVAILSLLQNQMWFIINMKEILQCDAKYGMNNEELVKMIQLAAALQREILLAKKLSTMCISQSAPLHPKYLEY